LIRCKACGGKSLKIATLSSEYWGCLAGDPAIGFARGLTLKNHITPGNVRAEGASGASAVFRRRCGSN
jgi:hypothetical protein